MDSQLRLSPLLLTGLLLLLTGVIAGAAAVSGLQAVNVGPRSFALTWSLDESFEPVLRVYADAGATSEVTRSLRIEVQALATGDPATDNREAARDRKRALTALMGDRHTALVRVGGAEPGSDYYAEAGYRLSSDPETIFWSGTLVEVRTASAPGFLVQSRQVVIDFSAFSSGLDGSIAILDNPQSAYPLAAVVGDHPGTGKSFFDLGHFMRADLTGAAEFSGPTDFVVSLLGRDVPADLLEQELVFDGELVVARVTVLPFRFGDTAIPAYFTFSTINSQVAGESFAISIQARASDGTILTGFEGSVELTANLTLSQGGGTSPAFSSGELADFPVTVAQAGTGLLTATRTGGTETGMSNSFTVEEALVGYLLTLDASPNEGGTVSGAGVYPAGASTSIQATAAPGYLFDRWYEAGTGDRYNSSETLTMNSDRSLTAVFRLNTASTFALWQQAEFLRNSTNPEIADEMADPEFDGVYNLYEYAFGMKPWQRDANRLPSLVRRPGGNLVLVFYRNRHAEDIEMEIQHAVGSLDASRWGELVHGGESVTPENGMVDRVEIDIDESLGDRIFIRVNVTRTEP